jgi:hypothetical protein
VYHPPDEDDLVLATKKGLASLLAAKLYREDEDINKMNHKLSS